MQCNPTQYGFNIEDGGKSLAVVERCCSQKDGKRRWYLFEVRCGKNTFQFNVQPRKTRVFKNGKEIK